jgi:hypothetical protein
VHSVFGKINYGGLKHNSLYLALVLPSGGWQSLIIYNNDFTSIIDIYFYETLFTLIQNNKHLRFPL